GIAVAPQCALWAVILAVAAVDDVRRAHRSADGGTRELVRGFAAKLLPRWAAGALVSLTAFAPQLLAWKALYGEYVSSPQGPGFMWWTEPAWSEVLFSSTSGLLPWSPLYALAGAGLFVGLRR